MILMQIAVLLRHSFFCRFFRVLDLLVFVFFDGAGSPLCSLHVLCNVNIYKKGTLVFSSNMLSYAYEGEKTDEELPYGVDLNLLPLASKDKTKGDIAMACINAGLPIRMEQTCINADGRMILIAENHIKICIAPHKSSDMEQWRLVVLNQRNQHIVCSCGAIWEE